MATPTVVLTAQTGGLLLATILIVGMICYRFALPTPLAGIPHNKHSTQRVMGDLPDLAKFNKETRLFWAWLTMQVEKINSPIIQVFMAPLGKPHVVISDYREAHDILVHRHKEFDRADFFAETMGPLAPEGHILFKSDDKFRLHRKVIGDLMSPSFLQHVAAPSLYVNLCKHIQLWDAKIALSQGRPFEAMDDIYYSALDAVTSFAFSDNFPHNATGSRVEFYSALPQSSLTIPDDEDAPVVFPKSPITDDFVEALRDLSLVYDEALAAPLPKLAWFFILRRESTKKAVQVKDSVFGKEIDLGIDRIRGGKDGSRVKSALDHMLFREATIAEKEGRLPDFHRRMIYDETITFISAGHDTSSTTLCWGIKRLADNPGIQEKLRKQLRATLSAASSEGRWPTHNEILRTSMPYLDAVVEEMLRLAQPVPGLVRQATCDTQILGHFVPKGTQVFMLANGPSFLSPAMLVEESLRTQQGRDSKESLKMWKEDGSMASFMPERWLVPAPAGTKAESTFDGFVFDQTAGPMMAFSLGPRGCFGRRLAYMSLKLLLTLIAWNYELLPCGENLSSYTAHDILTNRPDFCYVRPRKL
ncbi:Cytochrome P450 monooxygenase [Colletotrichum higginsianum IMI 349063]|uniref:Cytochrome P450 monooxygenase n=1 Tax=Colletotrichum higginsianum (strain IMI 349063) TaxID=759273 RepID=A0A1B7XTL6_COLHI|nr:Cytochrome P450 monooxygenase [Colletotrichum higginsianum IMI 349063]OBR03096.1 Cytochrome P450 monooxygenase [Colletotrichum higginsianum IMI 349063]